MTEKSKRSRARVPVGKELAKIRIDRDETLLEMAKNLGMHNTHLTRVETGVSMFTSEMALKVKDIYGVDLSGMVNVNERKLVFQLADLTPDEISALMAIRDRIVERQSGKAVAPMSAPVAAPVRVVRAPVDNDGVDFIDDLDELDDLE